MLQEDTITHTIVMTFQDAKGSVRSLKVPGARPNITAREVRQVMETIVRIGRCLSHKGRPLVKIIHATLVIIRWIFVAPKKSSAEQSTVETARAEDTKSMMKWSRLHTLRSLFRYQLAEIGHLIDPYLDRVKQGQAVMLYCFILIHHHHGRKECVHRRCQGIIL